MIEAILAINRILDRKQKLLLFLLTVLMLVTAILETLGISMVIPYIAAVVQPEKLVSKPAVLWAMNIFSITSTKELMVALTVFMILVYVVKNGLLYFVNIQVVRFANKSKMVMMKRLMLALLSRPYSFYLQSDTSSMFSLFTSDISKVYEIISALLIIVTEFFVAITVFCLLCIVDWKVTLTFLIMLGLLFVLLEKIIKPKIAKLGSATWTSWGKYVKVIAETFGGIKEIKVQRAENKFYSMFFQAGDECARLNNREVVYASIPKVVTELACIGSVLSVMLVQIINDSYTPEFLGVMSLFALASIRLVPSSNRIHGALNAITYRLSSLRPVQLQLSDVQGNVEADITEKVEYYQLHSEISFANVSFKYSDNGPLILDRANIVIRKGSKVGIIGATGSGKTTTMNLLLGLLQPWGGEILVDGQNMHAPGKKQCMRIGFVPQDIFLVNDTIKANIVFGREIDEEGIGDVLVKAELDDFVKTLPKGVDTIVGERGIRLSGGQKQRLGIARALYGNPEVILCDEATSALDNETEQDVIKSVYNLGKDHTVIMIAHRLTTIEYCDVVYKVEDGKIYEVTEEFFKEHPHKG